MNYYLADPTNLLAEAKLSRKKLDCTISRFVELVGEEKIKSIKDYHDKRNNLTPVDKNFIYVGLLKELVTSNTLKIIEISNYFRVLKDFPNFNKVLNDLLDIKHFQDFYYLFKIAYILSLTNNELVFEPAINGKTPDLKINGDTSFLCEMTQISNTSNQDTFEQSWQQVMKSFERLTYDKGIGAHLEISLSTEDLSNKLPEILKYFKSIKKGLIDNRIVKDFDGVQIKFIPIYEFPSNDRWNEYAYIRNSFIVGDLARIPGQKTTPETWNFSKNTRTLFASFAVNSSEKKLKDIYKSIESSVEKKYENYKKYINEPFYLFVNLPDPRWYDIDYLDKDKILEVTDKYLKESSPFYGIFITRESFKTQYYSFLQHMFIPNHNKDDVSLSKKIRNNLNMINRVGSKFLPLSDKVYNRNDKCLCGCDHKYKVCCGAFDIKSISLNYFSNF